MTYRWSRPNWYAESGVELRLGTRVAGVDPGRRLVRLADSSTVAYGDLVLATGSGPPRSEWPAAIIRS